MSVTEHENVPVAIIAQQIEAEKALDRTQKQNNRRNQTYSLARNFDLSMRNPVQWKMKRLLDVSASLIGLALISPLLFIIALSIKLDSRGPILFKQKRIGLHGQEFYMYKFRSMRQDSEKILESIKHQNETNSVMFKMFNDPRVTRIGKFLRKFSLDELPQLFNVVRGDMSLVGPRPPLPREVALYNNWHFIKFGITPGITGVWQVSGRAKITDFNKVIEMDYDYIRNWNIWLDIKLLLKTIPVVIFAKGAA